MHSTSAPGFVARLVVIGDVYSTQMSTQARVCAYDLSVPPPESGLAMHQMRGQLLLPPASIITQTCPPPPTLAFIHRSPIPNFIQFIPGALTLCYCGVLCRDGLRDLGNGQSRDGTVHRSATYLSLRPPCSISYQQGAPRRSAKSGCRSSSVNTTTTSDASAMFRPAGPPALKSPTQIEMGGQPGNQLNRVRGQAVAGANFSGASSYRSEEGDCRFRLHLKYVNYLTTQVWRVETRDTKETASNRLVQKLVTLPSR
ncbi:hypothetical protein EGR_09076 [Echinococcus granulosus]|uniref:Uncharacterized protein n=1 Tax=Echinococcus granulosus TaxID=6210 RepID=W6U6U5_ECHGR|nr:hypothetical protein EGR_09076 [Echinococcus granulosus]EUB56086.1 hypothetical protein EGR_09076 [Echinococcus granulosus]